MSREGRDLRADGVLLAGGPSCAGGEARRVLIHGGASRDRTDDLIVANDAVRQDHLTDSNHPYGTSLSVFTPFIGSITEAQPQAAVLASPKSVLCEEDGAL